MAQTAFKQFSNPLENQKQDICQKDECANKVSWNNTSLELLHGAQQLSSGSYAVARGPSEASSHIYAGLCGTGRLPPLVQWPEAPTSSNLDAQDVNLKELTPLQESFCSRSIWSEGIEIAQKLDLKNILIHPVDLLAGSKEEEVGVHVSLNEIRKFGSDKEETGSRTEPDREKLEKACDLISPGIINSGKKPKIQGVSLVDFFTPEEVKEHIFSLRQGIRQEAKENGVGHFINEDSCQLCAMEKLFYAPAPIYCSRCDARVKNNSVYYYGFDESNSRRCFCNSCFKGSLHGKISFNGVCISKSKLRKGRNDHRDDETWVQCGICSGWQHQICALYNSKMDVGGEVDYICPNCYLEGIRVGEYVPLPKTIKFGAKDLPTTRLSDHIEQRLFRRLKQEREERAQTSQNKFDEVPGAADLVVRVVSSMNKLLKVNKQFLDVIQREDYPKEFSCKSKVILLFQKIDGVDVCLFGMLVQEFGSQCRGPNHRCVYISYLDSVKYFRPNIRSASGEALRTFAYHEILIGYLGYCKEQGFSTSYIWASPPLEGEDYILHCHPETQKIPRSDKLCQWYKSMLKKAAKENIVVNQTNLYDQFFENTGKHNMKITAARLPYFEDAYWISASADIIKNIDKGTQSNSPRKTRKGPIRRTLKSMGHTNFSDDATKDILLMLKLGENILPSKENFLVVHLQYTCSNCREVILSGNRWYCSQCQDFQLCTRCHDAKENLNDGNTHISGTGERHSISQATVNDVPVDDDEDTDDDGIRCKNNYFEDRISFLRFCQENHYQFDSLRRAKYSSMMILYHLNNSSTEETSVFSSQDNIVENRGQNCPGYDDACQMKGDGGDSHTNNNLRHHIVNGGAENNEARKQRPEKVKEVHDLFKHAAICSKVSKRKSCSFPNCLRISKFFVHTLRCKTRLSGGSCWRCHQTERLVRYYSDNCQDSGCGVEAHFMRMLGYTPSVKNRL